MAPRIFQPENAFQNISDAASSRRNFSISEKLARYGSSALSGVEHLRLLVGKDSIVDAFSSISVRLRRCPEPHLKSCGNFFQKARRKP
jgi:hypothetical protein